MNKVESVSIDIDVEELSRGVIELRRYDNKLVVGITEAVEFDYVELHMTLSEAKELLEELSELLEIPNER